jgi:lysophospholipase L1-like esterase
MIRSVLCYGDSNTFGSATVDRPDGRYGPDERWPGVLRNALGSGWLVIEEGLGGRTTVSDDPIEGADKNGRSYLYPCLRSHRPLDVVAIMLGTNDLKHRFGKTPWDIAEGVGVLVSLVKASGAGRNEGVPEIIVIAPAPMLRELPMHAEMFVGGHEKSLELARYYKALSERLGIRFFDAGSVMKSSKVDGFHLDPDAHQALGKAVAAEIGKIRFAG